MSSTSARLTKLHDDIDVLTDISYLLLMDLQCPPHARALDEHKLLAIRQKLIVHGAHRVGNTLLPNSALAPMSRHEEILHSHFGIKHATAHTR